MIKQFKISTNDDVKQTLKEIENKLSKEETTETDIEIENNVINEANFKDIISFNQSHPYCRFHLVDTIPPTPKNNFYNQLFDALYWVNNRDKYITNISEASLKQTHVSSVKQPSTANLRKAKVDLVHGNRPKGLQIQQQQQQQQQQQTTAAVKKKRRKPKSEDQLESEERILKNPSDYSDLINKNNLYMELSTHLKEQYPNADTRPNLGKIWDALVGQGADEIEDSNRKITDVDKSTLKKIIEHYHEFSYGLMLENLPAGFYIEKTNDGKNILSFSEDPQFQQQKINPLTIQVEDPVIPDLPNFAQFQLIKMKQAYKESENYQEQIVQVFGKYDDFKKNTRSNEEQFKILFVPLSVVKDKKVEKNKLDVKKKEFWSFFKELTSTPGSEDKKEELENLCKDLESLCTSLDFKANHYTALAGILMNQGAEGVRQFLSQLDELNNNELYDDFNRIFLANSINYQSLMSNPGAENLKLFAQMGSTEKTWWNSLVKQHHEVGNRVDFNELFNAYQYFLTELKELGITKLPLSCPFTNIHHMKTALDRGLYIIKNATDPKEQLANLNGLDFGPHGAYMASRYDNYTTVLNKMKLNPSTDQGELKDKFTIEIPVYKTESGKGLQFEPPNLRSKPYPMKLLDLSDPIYKQFSDEDTRQGKPKMDFRVYKGNSENLYLKVNYSKENLPLEKTPAIKHKKTYELVSSGQINITMDSKTSIKIVYYDPKRFPDYTPSKRTMLFEDMKEKKNHDSMSEAYYRFIGTQDNSYPIDIYQEMEQLVLNDETLSQEDKGTFLSVFALVSTNDTPSHDPVSEAKVLLESLKNLNKGQNKFVFNIFSYIDGFLISGKKSEIKLSIIELKSVVDYIHTRIKNIKEEDSERNNDQTSHLLTNTTTFMTQLFEKFSANKASVIQILENTSKQIELVKDQTLTTDDFLLTVDQAFWEFIEKENDNALLFGKLFTLLKINVNPKLPTNQRLPPLFHEVTSCAEKFKKLELTDRALLLSALNEINLEESKQLLSIDDVKELLEDFINKKITINQTINKESKESLLEALRDRFPDTAFGSLKLEPQDGLTLLVKTIKGYVIGLDLKPSELIDNALGSDNSPIVNGIADALLKISGVNLIFSKKTIKNQAQIIINNIREKVKPTEESVNNLLQYLKGENPNINKLMALYDEFEKQLFELKEVPLLQVAGLKITFNQLQPFLKPLVTQYGGEKVGKYYDEVLIQNSLLFLIKEPLQERFNNQLTKGIKSLHTGQKSFDTFLLESLGELKLSSPLDKSLSQYNIRFNSVYDLVKQLIQLNNTSRKDCVNVIQLLAANDNQFAKLLPQDTLSKLLAELSKQNIIPVTQQLTIILDILKDVDVKLLDPKRLNVAFEQLDVLTKNKDILKADAYKMLLKLSFKHNVTTIERLFPINEIALLKSIEGIDEEQSQALFDHLITVLNNVDSTEEANKQVTLLLENLTGSIKDNVAKHPKIIDLANHMLKQGKAGLEDLKSINDLLSKVPTDTTTKDWLAVMTGVKDCPIDTLIELEAGLKQHAKLLPQIASLFEYPPYPPVDKLINELKSEDKDIKEFISNFDRDPLDRRKEATDIEKQFATNRLVPVVTEIKQMLEGSPLHTNDQYKLAEQLMYVNAIGKDFSLKIGNKNCDNLTQASRAELRQYSDILIKSLRSDNVKPGEAEYEHNQLKLLAVMKELYFRSTGNFPRITQTLAMLMSLKYPDNILMQINTGEGKGITTALLAALQWVKGGTVDVCTANRGLVHQDYTEKGNVNFFRLLGIPSSIVRSDSEYGTYQPGGINYTTVADLSLYRSRAKLENEPLDTVDGKTIHNDLVLDESDYTLLDDRTLFNYAVSAEGGGDSTKNPYAWIYPHINEFINQPEFKNLISKEDASVWTREKDIQELKIYLSEKADSADKKNQLIDLPDKKFDTWLNASCTAQQSKAGEDFIIDNQTREIDGVDRPVSIAIPLINNIPQQGASFSDGVQQFLQARLQKENKNQIFPIDAEMLFVATESCKNFIDNYHRSGRIVTMTGTGGTKEELTEQQFKFGVNSFSIPPYEKNKRYEFETQVKKNVDLQIKAIKLAIDEAQDVTADKNTQPILLICKDINQVREMHNRLKGYKSFTINMVTGEESEKERQELIEKAGKLNTITISTSLLGRGTDIDPKHRDGLFVIQTYLDKDRDTQQIVGRTARNGKPGKYVAIYEEHGLLHQYSTKSLSKMNKNDRTAAIKHMQKHMNEDGAIERHYLQEVDAIKQVLLKQFDHWYQLIQLTHSPNELPPKIKESLLLRREELIDSLGNKWKQHLEASDPNKKYPNPYIRRDAAGKLQTQDLDNAVKAFEADAITLWDKIKNDEQNGLKTINQPQPDDDINLFRAQCLDAVDISDELKLHHLNARKEKKQHVQEQKSNEQHVKYAEDLDGVFLKYTDVDLDEQEKKTHETKSFNSQIKLIQQNFLDTVSIPFKPDRPFLRSRLKGILQLEKDDTAASRDKKIIEAFQEVKGSWGQDLNIVSRIQPVLIQLISIVKDTRYKNEIGNHQQLKDNLNEFEREFIINVSDKLVNNLNSKLSWAKNQGWDFWIERSAVKTAAVEILKATEALKNASTNDQKKLKIKKLYKILQKEQVKLDSLWIFSFGHEDIRKLIQESLKTIDSLQKIADIDMSFKEEAVRELFIEKSTTVFNPHVLKNLPEDAIRSLMSNFIRITSENKSIYVAHELGHALKCFQARFPNNKSLQKLSKELRKEISNIETKHPNFLKESSFFEQKEKQILGKLKLIPNVKIERVSLERGHTGFKEFYKLVIKGTGLSDNLLEGFTRFNDDTFKKLNTRKEVLATELMKLNEKNTEIQTYIEQINPDNLNLIPIHTATQVTAVIQEKITTGNQYIDWIKEKPPLATSIKSTEHVKLTSEVSELQKQYEKVENMSFADLSSDMADELTDPPKTSIGNFALEKMKLNTEIQSAQTKIDELTAKRKILEEKKLELSTRTGINWLYNASTKIITNVFRTESVESISKEINVLAGTLNTLRKKTTEDLEENFTNSKPDLLKKIDQKITNQLTKELHDNVSDVKNYLLSEQKESAKKIETLSKNSEFLDKEIRKEKLKSGLISKEFSSLDEVLDFEDKISNTLSSNKNNALEIKQNVEQIRNAANNTNYEPNPTQAGP